METMTASPDDTVRIATRVQPADAEIDRRTVLVVHKS
jgi:hypothetical protein